MKILSKAANLSKIYTNHSVRATAITLWSDAGLSNRHIMSLSGHRNENSSSRVCITVSNSPNPSRVYIRLCKHRKRFLLLKHNPTEPYIAIHSPTQRYTALHSCTKPYIAIHSPTQPYRALSLQRGREQRDCGLITGGDAQHITISSNVQNEHFNL